MVPLVLLTLGLLTGTLAAPFPGSTPFSCLDKKDDGQTYSTVKGVFEVVCGKDFGGNDISATNEESFEACINTCSTTTGCVNVAYVWGSCYLKSKSGDATEAAHVWSAKLQAVDVPVVNTALTCVDNKDNGRNFITPKGTYHVECGIDFEGNDIKAAQVANFEACIAACSETTGCISVSFVYGSCYLKSRKGDAVTAAHVWGASLVTSTPEVSTLTCVNKKDDAKVYTSLSGGSYLISCAIDYEGGDYSSLVVSSFEACITACDNEAQCIDLSYVDGSCYLKNVQTAALVRNHVWSAKRVTPNGSTSSSTTSSAVTTTVSSSSASVAPTPTYKPASCTLKSPLPNSVCGTTGYTITNARVILERTEAEYTTPEGCALLCSETVTCAWYILGKDTPTSPTVCMLESGAPKDGGFYSVPGVLYSAWSSDCFVCTPRTLIPGLSTSTTTTQSTSSTVLSTSSSISTQAPSTTTTTSSTPIPTSCQVIKPLPANLVCGTIGYVQTHPELLLADLVGPYNPESCALACFKKAGCASSNTGTNPGGITFCQLYSSSQKALGFTSVQASFYSGWDQACFECTASSAASTTSSTITASSTLSTITTSSTLSTTTTSSMTTTTSSVPVATALSCTGATLPYKTFSDGDGNDWEIRCGVDYPNNDLAPNNSPTFETCIASCKSLLTCVGVTWITSGPTPALAAQGSNSCYLKSAIGPARGPSQPWNGPPLTTAILKNPFKILNVMYSTLDITIPATASWLQGNNIVIDTSTWWTLKSDPWFGITKSCTVLYTFRGQMRMWVSYDYSGVFTITPGPVNNHVGSTVVPTWDVPSGVSDIKIIGASWGFKPVVPTASIARMYTSYAANTSWKWDSPSMVGTANDVSTGTTKSGVIYYRNTKTNALMYITGRESSSGSWARAG